MASVMSCDDYAIRCVNPEGTIGDDYCITRACMMQVEIADTCWCSHMAEDYADVGSAKAGDFEKCCQSFPNYSARYC